MMHCYQLESSHGHYANINEGGDRRYEGGVTCNGKVYIPSLKKIG
jgi:hypothetical protein